MRFNEVTSSRDSSKLCRIIYLDLDETRFHTRVPNNTTTNKLISVDIILICLRYYWQVVFVSIAMA
jgi:hypothetical protein